MAKKKKANKISPFVGWSVSLAQNKDKVKPKNFRKEYYNPVPGHAAYTDTKSTRKAVTQLYRQLKTSPVGQPKGERAKTWKSYQRMWNPKDVTGSMDKIAANYETADELSRFMYTILRAKQGQSTELLDDARDGKIDETGPAPRRDGNAVDNFFAAAKYAHARNFNGKDEGDNDQSPSKGDGGFFGKVKGFIGDRVDDLDKATDHVPGLNQAKEVADSDYFRAGMEKSLDIISRPLFGAAEATRQFNRANKDHGPSLRLDGTGPIDLAISAQRALFGTSPVDALDDARGKDYKRAAKGALRGLSGKEKTTYARVIADNAKRDNRNNIYDRRAYQIAAGLTGDLLGDPLNFVGVGVVRAPVKVADKVRDRSVYNLAKDLAKSEIPKPGTNELYSPTELYHALGGSSTKRSGLQKSQDLERAIETVEHVRGHLKTPLVATDKGINQRAHKLYRLEQRGRRAVAKRDAQLESFVKDYEAGKVNTADQHFIDTITEEAQRSVGDMVRRGEIPEVGGVDEVLDVAKVRSAITQHRFFERKSKKLVEAEDEFRVAQASAKASKNPDALARAEAKLQAAQAEVANQQDLHRALGPGWSNNPHLDDAFRESALSRVADEGFKNDPGFRKAQSAAKAASQKFREYDKVVKNLESQGVKGEKLKNAKQNANNAWRKQKALWDAFNTHEASVFIRLTKNQLDMGGMTSRADDPAARELLEAELSKVDEELARVDNDALDQSYTGMTPDDYNTLLANENSSYTPQGEVEVPFSRRADLENRKRFLERELNTPKSALAPPDIREIRTPEHMADFRLTEPDGQFTEDAKDLFRFNTEEGQFEVRQDLDPDVQSWADSVASALNHEYQKSLMVGPTSVRRAREARKSEREFDALSESTKKMFTHPEGRDTLTGTVQGPNGPIHFGQFSDDIVEESDTKNSGALLNHLKLSKENLDNGAEISPVLKRKANMLRQIVRGLGMHPPVGSPEDFVKWALHDDVYPKLVGRTVEGAPQDAINAAITPESLAFLREFRKQHGISYSDALIKRDKELGKVVKWSEKSRYKKQALTKQETLDRLMSGDPREVKRVLLGNALDFKVPMGAKEINPKGGNITKFRKAAKANGGDWKTGEDAFLAAATNYINTEPMRAAQEMSSAWTRAYRKQIAQDPTNNPITEATVNPKLQPDALTKAAATSARSKVGAAIQHNRLMDANPNRNTVRLQVQGTPDEQAIRAALREKQAEAIAEAKNIPSLAKRNATIKALRENHAKEKAAYEEAFEKAKNTRKLMLKRLDEDFLLRLIDADVNAPGRRLSAQTWGDTDLFAIPGSQTLFAAANKLGNLPIIKQTRQVFANAFVPPSGALPRELNLARNRALGNTPQIIAAHIKELKDGMGSFHASERISSFNGWREGAKIGNAGDSIDEVFKDLLPYFSNQYVLKPGTPPISIYEINRYLPSHLQVKTGLHETIKTPQRLIQAMENGGAHARKMAGTRREVKQFPKDPMDIAWETRVAVEQAVARRALIDVINSFGVMRKATLEDGRLVPVPNHELVEELGSKHGWKTVANLSKDYGISDTHYFPPEVMDDLDNLLDLMEPHNLTSFGRLVDEVTGAWKAGATMYNPGYYTRNGMGEMMSSWFDGVKTAKPYRRAVHMQRFMNNEGAELEALKSHIPALSYVPTPKQSDIAKKTAAVLRNGTKINMEKATVLYFDQGLKTGFFNTERTANSKFGKLAQRLREAPGTKQATKGHEKLREIGEGWEDHFRIAHFLDALEKAPRNMNELQAAEWAADKVRRYHFDYTDFTQFEKTVMLRVFPFYKWTRKAAPLMMTMLFTKPGKAMAYPKVMNAVSQGVSSNDLTEADPNGFMPNYEGIVPEWMRDMWAYKIDEEDNAAQGQGTYFKLTTPQMDIYSQMGNPVGTASMLTNPLIKTPYEQLAGESFPGGNMDLKIEGGDKRIDQLMRQLPATSYLNKEMRGRSSDEARASFASGVGIYKNDEMSQLMEGLRTGQIGGEEPKEAPNPADTKKGPSSASRTRELVDTLLRDAYRKNKSAEGKKPDKEEEDRFVLQGFKHMEAPLQAQYRISTPFGPRTHPITGKASNHTGIDLAADGGSAVYAPNDGTVVFSGWDDIYGNKIIVDFGKGKRMMFGHLDQSKVNYGQKVRKGDSIGYVGSTGLSTGPHLHWETWDNGVPVNPQQFLGGG